MLCDVLFWVRCRTHSACSYHDIVIAGRKVGVSSMRKLIGRIPFLGVCFVISIAAHLFTSIKKRSVFAMSERPTSDIKLPKLKDLVIALKDLVECHALGLQLGLPESTLKLIDKHHDSKEHLRMMLSEWLQFDTEASWEKLAAALNKIGKNAIADNVRREFLRSDTVCTSTVELSSPPVPAPEKRREGPSDEQAGPFDNAPVEQDTGKRKYKVV